MRTYRLTLTVQGPVLTRSTAIGGYGVDAPVARAADGTPMLAGSHVQGKLRQAWAELNECVRAARCAARREGTSISGPASVARIGQWLGRPDEGEGQRRGSVFIGDLFATVPGAVAATRGRVAIELSTGAAKERALAVLETPFASRAAVAFTGRVTILAKDSEADVIADAIERGLNWVPQFGGERTIGFGRTLGVELQREDARAPQTHASASPTEDPSSPACARLRLVLRFLEPFCISAAPRSNNVFESESSVPGAAIKGALANQMAAALGLPAGAAVSADPADARFRYLRRWFDALRFLHAVPVPIAAAPGSWPVAFGADPPLEGALAPTPPLRGWPPRPRVWPLSLVAGRKGGLFDVALCEGPKLIDDTAPPPADPHQRSGKASAPRFVHDWKGDDFARANALFGLSEPPRALRLRTSMDQHLRAGAPEQLFANELVLPDQHLWVGEIDLADVSADQRGGVLDDLIELTQGLISGIGKTHALAQMGLMAVPAEAATPAAAESLAPLDGHFVVTLQTPALLCSNLDLLGAGSGQDKLERAYRRAFANLSGGRVELVRYFARQRLAGGAFFLQRFAGNGTYLPWLLTEAGSVFVLGATDRGADVAKTLRGWLEQGLSLPESVLDHHELRRAPGETCRDASLWAQCPYIRQNGYGEVAINMAVHRTCDLRLLRGATGAAP
ncbi:MAG: hypothetical protein EA405_08730 [Rhodospirillales bacterium]|nr:MAG: hypothetical protein EA405_08730 [Rhodospirillales bacterium]